ncbi:hypothetical protein AB0A94_25245 [Streptomyces sp. NPDC044984]|uniref:hypothetical protein n=1 Tax=Streptomyces sp. NPDC044984 TaxID=3154335 RepID=UPI0033FBB77E
MSAAWWWTEPSGTGRSVSGRDPTTPTCRVALSLFPEAPAQGARRRLSLVFAPGPDRAVSNAYFEAGTVVRLPDRARLDLYEPGTVRRLLDAAAPVPDVSPSVRDLDVDGRPCFTEVVDRPANEPTARTSRC